jgi:hypothetical protein
LVRKNNTAFFLLVISFTAQLGHAEPRREQGIVITGVAGRQSSRSKSIEKALEDAARRAAFYHSVGGITYDLEISGYGFSRESALYYDEDYTKYIKDLQFDSAADVAEEGDVFFVRAFYASELLPIEYEKPPGNAKPFWIDNPPKEISGYPAATGMAGRQSTAAKTIIVSYENAVYGFLQNYSAWGKIRQIESEGSLLTVSSFVSAGTVYGFYVVDFWTDPETKAVWTLAAARAVIPKDFSEEEQ